MTERFVVQFAAHTRTQSPDTVFSDELSWYFGATVTELPDRRAEITGFRKSKAAGILNYPRAEEARGVLRVESAT